MGQGKHTGHFIPLY